MKATGVMPDNMICAADVVAEKMKEHGVELAQKVKSFSTVLEEAQASTLGTLSLASVDGRHKHGDQPLCQFSQIQKRKHNHQNVKHNGCIHAAEHEVCTP